MSKGEEISGTDVMEGTKDTLIWAWEEKIDGASAKAGAVFIFRMAEAVKGLIDARNELRSSQKLPPEPPPPSAKKVMELYDWLEKNRQDERLANAHTEAERKRDANYDGPCYCGNKAVGAWGLRIGYGAPYHYTPKMPYCLRCLPEMILGLKFTLRDLEKIGGSRNGHGNKTH